MEVCVCVYDERQRVGLVYKGRTPQLKGAGSEVEGLPRNDRFPLNVILRSTATKNLVHGRRTRGTKERDASLLSA